MNELAQLVVQNVGAISVTAGFLWYLTKRDKEFTGSLDSINKTLNDHSKQDIKIQKELVKSLTKINDKLKDK